MNIDKATMEQKVALLGVYQRQPMSMSYAEFRRSAFPSINGCVMVSWCGMVLGIEKNGYVHS